MTTEVEHYMQRCAELSARLAEVEQALQELAHWKIAQSHDAVQMRSFARAVLDKGEPDG